MALLCATLARYVYQSSGLKGGEGGRLVPSLTYIKEGLWMGMRVSSHAKLFEELNAFGLSAYLALLCSDYHELQTEKRSCFFVAHYYKTFCLLFPRWSPRKWHHTCIQKKSQKEEIWLPLGRSKKSFNFFLINRFSLHEIFIKMDCLTQRWVLSHICIFKPPIISSLKFHLVASVDQRIPLMKVS